MFELAILTAMAKGEIPVRTIYLLFLFSGVAGLIYEIVWGRMMVLVFGSTTNSIVATISAFLGGLALGSLIFGQIADRLSPRALLKTYVFLEAAVGLAALSTLATIPLVRAIYSTFSDGSVVDIKLLVIKFALSIVVMLLPATFMGATLPILVKFVQSQKEKAERAVSMLYCANTFGAVLGVLLSAFILIELIGLRASLLAAVLINLSVAMFANRLKVISTKIEHPTRLNFSSGMDRRSIAAVLAFFLSGMVSIAYEILWTRILTPSVGTFIYAFAAILAIYLFGIAIGSFLYRGYSRIITDKSLAFAICEAGIGFFALASVYLVSNQVAVNGRLMVLLVILPATIFMGLSFPAVISLIGLEKHSGKVVGGTYFANTFGSIIGGFLASLILIPRIGSTQSVILLSLVNFAIALAFIFTAKRFTQLTAFALTATIFLLVFTGWLFVFKKQSLHANETQWRLNWARERGINYLYKEDEVASVFAYRNEAEDRQDLYIDGVPTTNKVGETALMAHIPLFLHSDPRDVLVIAFGMGTTFRSSLSWGVGVDAVELVPSVPMAMNLFYSDAPVVLSNPKGRVIINDGRNYAFLTSKKYDVIIIDPPPPFNAAGTTVLYSEEFYRDLARKLYTGGIVSQWIFFDSRIDDIAMATKSFVNVFPYIKVYRSPDNRYGFFLEGSFSPFVADATLEKVKLANQGANKNFTEHYSTHTLSDINKWVIGDRDTLIKWIGSTLSVSDDRPRTEYFLLRHLFSISGDTKGKSATEVLGSPVN